MGIKLTVAELDGVKRPAFDKKKKGLGPFPPGVVNGPQPTTERGRRRRRARCGFVK